LYEISEMADILNIGGEPIFDDRVVKIETHTYNPYANTTFGHNEIKIPIQQQDLHVTMRKFSVRRGKIEK